MDASYGARYADLYRRHWWWRAREEFIVRQLERRVGTEARGDVLDFGCGDGLFLSVLERFGTPYGIEPEAALLDAAGPWRSRISTAPLAPDPAEAGRYRLIVALDVLEHIAEPLPVVSELARRLTPDGWFVVTVPALASLWTTHDDLNHHQRRYDLAEIEALLRAGGLEIAYSRYFFSWLAIVKWFVARAERVVRPEPRSPSVPWAPVNAAVLLASRAEHALTRSLRPPFGSSILVMARARR